MGAVVEIRDIKIINQCLEVQEGVVACLFSFSVSLSLYSSHAVFLSFFLSHTHCLLCSLWTTLVYDQSPEVSPVKVVLNAATHKSTPRGQSHPLSGSKREGYHVYYMCVCLCLCVSAAIISRQLIAQLPCCNLLMDHL